VRVHSGGRTWYARGKPTTIVTYGLGVHWALEEAERLAAEGVEIEIVDLRTLIPLDLDTVVASIRKTNRALVLHEAPLTAGFGAELVARISEAAFEHLDAPPLRVGGADMPVPFSTTLEQDIYAGKGRLGSELRRLLSF
jgi:2-oxoisovalerate dehydrogenase E1 component